MNKEVFHLNSDMEEWKTMMMLMEIMRINLLEKHWPKETMIVSPSMEESV